MNISENNIVGEIVAKDYRAAAVFEGHGIDFCCNGNRSLSEVCAEKGLNAEAIIGEVEKSLKDGSATTVNFDDWSLDLLVEYIERKHHRFVKKQIPVIQKYLDKICQVHGRSHPELYEIQTLFAETARDMTSHMQKEEHILFPFIKKIAQAEEEGTGLPSPPFGTVENPIEMMKHEHDVEGNRFRKIVDLSNNYTAPADGCTTYEVAFSLLKEFQDDLHLHIHLENNILFIKALELEGEMTAVN